jgi:hypothetical protein
MQKNVAGQKWIVFAFRRTNNLPVTGDAANITANLRLDVGAANPIDSTNPTELEAGYYYFDLTQAETNAGMIAIIPVSATPGVLVIGVPGVVWTQPYGGAGSVPHVYTVTVDGSPAVDVLVVMTTDALGLNPIDQGRTDALGQVTFYPDLPVGTPVYLWRFKTAVVFSNPDQEVTHV